MTRLILAAYLAASVLCAVQSQAQEGGDANAWDGGPVSSSIRAIGGQPAGKSEQHRDSPEVRLAAPIHARRTFRIAGQHDCREVRSWAAAVGLTVTPTPGAREDHGCTLTLSGPLEMIRLMDQSCEDVTDTGGDAHAE
jgi:hypothetical protein